MKAIAEKRWPTRARLLKRLPKVEDLAPADQRAVLKVVEALAHSQQRRRREDTTAGPVRAPSTDRVSRIGGRRTYASASPSIRIPAHFIKI